MLSELRTIKDLLVDRERGGRLVHEMKWDHQICIVPGKQDLKDAKW